MIDISWSDLKSLIDAGSIEYRHIELSNKYIVIGFDGSLKLRCSFFKADSEATEYESSYKSKGEQKSKKEITVQPAFASKQLPDGTKLFRRVHGVKATLSGDTTISLVVPYNLCKINALEIVWAPAGLRADLKVYDTPTGTISTIPNYLLNQFGFDSGIAKDYYSETSQYDADLIKDMKIEVTLKNPDSLTGDVCVNFILHEMKA